MSLRIWQFASALGAGVALLAPLFAQSGPAAKPAPKSTAKPDKAWTLPRTPEGKPDFEGFWTNATFTPLERPVELGNKEFFTEQEAIAYAKQREMKENSQSADDIHYDNVLWQSEHYSKGVSNYRTSMIFDPPNGRIPPLTAKGQERAKEVKEAARRRERAEKVQDRTLAERCISWGNEGPPMIGSTYNANLEIVQTADAVFIRHEIGHAVRMIPTNGTPHLPAEIRQLGGDSRGHWEGDTLVVDSTNFTDETNFRGPPATTRQDIFSSRDLHVVERFTRTDADTIVYRFRVEDPSTWTQPWSGELIMHRIEGPIYEYACHEGNYGLANILAGARAAERAAAAKAGSQ
jgi:hypothetical protein